MQCEWCGSGFYPSQSIWILAHVTYQPGKFIHICRDVIPEKHLSQYITLQKTLSTRGTKKRAVKVAQDVKIAIHKNQVTLMASMKHMKSSKCDILVHASVVGVRENTPLHLSVIGHKSMYWCKSSTARKTYMPATIQDWMRLLLTFSFPNTVWRFAYYNHEILLPGFWTPRITIRH